MKSELGYEKLRSSYIAAISNQLQQSYITKLGSVLLAHLKNGSGRMEGELGYEKLPWMKGTASVEMMRPKPRRRKPM
jgi:hypothetical protein